MEAGKHRDDKVEVEEYYIPPERGPDPAVHVLYAIQNPITPEDAFGPESRNTPPPPEQES